MSVCAACQQPLEVEIDHSEDEDDMMDTGASSSAGPSKQSQTVPDDVHLPCGDHFHWQCLLDSYQIENCPKCNHSLVSVNQSMQQQELRVNLHNEGGVQQNLDILPLLREEQYLRAYPEERKARAFLEFCRENDLNAIIEMITDGDDDDDEEMDADDVRQKPMQEILVYQDPLANMQSGLHAAVQQGHRDLAWLLLLVASDLDYTEFPVQVFQEAEAMGVMREERIGAVDIRSLKDGEGKSAEDIARESDNPLWGHDGWIGTGRLRC